MRTTLIKKGKIRVIIVILVIICSIINFLKIKNDSKRWVDADVTVKLPFEIDILSTGKSDFILIESEGKFVVIDCGFYENATKIENISNVQIYNLTEDESIVLKKEITGSKKSGIRCISGRKYGEYGGQGSVAVKTGA